MQITLILDDSWQPIYARALAEHGAAALKKVVENWLKDRQNVQDGADAKVVWEGRKALTTEEKAAIPDTAKAKLKII